MVHSIPTGDPIVLDLEARPLCRRLRGRHNLQRIQCRSENSKGVYCLQYDDEKIISGLRAQGVSGPSSSCVWNPRVFADDARGWQ